MIFTETVLPGAFIIEIEPRADNRGFFARTFCQNEFKAHGLNPVIAQANIAFNAPASPFRFAAFHFSSMAFKAASSAAAFG